MKFKSIFLAAGLVLIFTTSVFADSSIKAEVDKTAITTDDTITYKLTIISSEKKIPEPKFPSFEGFMALSQAQTSEISISKDANKTFVVYVFIIAPIKTGKLKISPAQILIAKKQLSSESFDIEVKQGKKQIQPKSEQEPNLPQEEPQGSEQPKITL